MTALALVDLQPIEDEPRILDVRLAERLGFANPRQIRELIKRNIHDLERYGAVSCRTTLLDRPQGGTVEVQEYWLNEGQAIRVCSRSDTEFAEVATHEVITIFLAYRRGQLPARRQSKLLDVLENGFQIIRGEFHDVRGEIKGVRDSLEEHKKDTSVRFDKIENVIYLKNKKPPFSADDWEMWRQVILLDGGGIDPSGSGQKLLDEDGNWLPNVHGDHFNREQPGATNGWPVPDSINQALREFNFRESKRHWFKVFQDKLNLRFPDGTMKKKKNTFIGKVGSKAPRTMNHPDQESFL